MGQAEIDSGRWVLLGNRFYRYRVAYQSVRLTDSAKEHGALRSAIVFGSTHGGVVGLIGNQGWGIDFPLVVFSGSGRLIAEIPLQSKVRVAAATWLQHGDTNVCVMVYEDGTVSQVEVARGTGTAIWKADIIEKPSERVADAFFCKPDSALGQCLVCRTVTGEFVWVANLEDRQQINPQRIVQVYEDVYPVTVMPRRERQARASTIQAQIRSDGSLLVFAIDYRNRLWCVDSKSGHSVSLSGVFTSICLSPHKPMLAAMEENGQVSVTSIPSLETLVTASHPTCEAIAWCASDSICLIEGNHLTLIGHSSEQASIKIDQKDSGALIWTEPDGLRVWTSECIAFIDPVSLAVERSLGPGSSQPARVLIDATEAPVALERHTTLRGMHQDGILRAAVDDLFETARDAWDTNLQQRLLKAAAHGAMFLHSQDPQSLDSPDSRVVHTANVLRVLNAVRREEVGIALSAHGLVDLGIPVLLERVCGLGLYSLAIQLSAFTGGVSFVRVLASWGVSVVSGKSSDMAVVVRRFLEMQNLWRVDPPFGEVAAVALEVENAQAARTLIQYEKRPSVKVQVLLELGDNEEALLTAAQSMDSDCLMRTLMHVLDQGGTGALRTLIRIFRSGNLDPRTLPRTMNVLACTLRQMERWNELKGLYSDMGVPHETANISVELIGSSPSEERAERLEKLANHLMRTTGAKKATVVFESNAIRSAAMVSAVGSRLEQRLGLPVGTLLRVSSSEMLAIAAVKLPGESTERGEELVRIRRELRIPDRRFFWMCLTAMSSVDDFEGVSSLCAGGGEPPIGFGAFVEACLKRRNVEEARKYAHRVSDARERARALARCGLGREGAEIAARLNNQTLMEEVASLAVGSLSLKPSGASPP